MEHIVDVFYKILLYILQLYTNFWQVRFCLSSISNTGS